MRISVLLLFGALQIFLSSCDQQGNDTENDPNSDDAIHNRVLILCEGSFGQSNSSISQYDKKQFSLMPNAFQFVNDYNPGDVLQSVTSVEDKLFFVVNGSAKIEISDTYSLGTEAPIGGLTSPRSLVHTGVGHKAYVSNIFSNEIQIVDISSKNVTGAIDIHGWSEEMIIIGDRVFVCKANGGQVMVIDTNTDSLVDSISVTEGPVNVLQDVDGFIWVLSNGNFGESAPTLTKISSDSLSIVNTIEIPEPWSYSMAMKINGEGDQLYVLNGSVYTMFTTDSELDPDPFIETGISYYGLGVDPETGDVYVADANDFVTIGVVERYSYSGTLIDEFQVGVAPKSFHFGK